MKILLVVLFLSITTMLVAQEKSLVAIKLTNGNEYVGIIEKDDGREIYVMTQSIGGIYLLKTEIRSIKPVNGETQLVQEEIRDTGPTIPPICSMIQENTVMTLPCEKATLQFTSSCRACDSSARSVKLFNFALPGL